MPERDLDKLLRAMQPVLDPREWVFCCIDPSESLTLEPIATFDESEGRTVVIEHAVARERGMESRFPSRRITLNAYSDLEAVGFLAAVTFELAKHGIPTNTFSAVHHDHIFVPSARADEAMHVLKELSAAAL